MKGMPCWAIGMPGAMDLDITLFLLLVYQAIIRYSGVKVCKWLELLRKLLGMLVSTYSGQSNFTDRFSVSD